ncbi:MAG: hypothetical protein ACOYT8_04090 [Candidatus Dependentiae bacterium]
MEFKILELTESGTYFSGPNNSYYLMFLSKIFTDGQSFTNWIIEELTKKSFKGLSGNMITVNPVNDNKIQIGDVFWYEYDTEPIEIDKQELLRIAREGSLLMDKDVAYIVLTREDEKSPIAITDQLPETIELYTEHKQLKYRVRK